MRRASAIQVLDYLHAAQNDFYSGGDENALRGLLVADITWTVPGALVRLKPSRRCLRLLQ